MIFKTPEQAAKFLSGIQALPSVQQQQYADDISEAMFLLISSAWHSRYVAAHMAGIILPAQLFVKIARHALDRKHK